MIFWTLRARRRVDQALAATPLQVPQTMQQLEELLRDTFPGLAVRVVVQDQYVGYRPNPYQFVLLVEVEGEREPGWVRPYVVKFDLAPNGTGLREEWQAWLSCRPQGLEHDIVLMTLSQRVEREGRTFALVYGDAQQYIGVPRITSLEDAMMEAVQFGSPTVASVRNSIFQLFERLGQLLYAVSYDEPPRTDPATALPERPNMTRLLDAWKRGIAAHERAHPERVDVLRSVSAAAAAFPQMPCLYIEPTRYLRSLPHTLQAQGARHVSDRPWIPSCRCGRGHGDLHGRNILVGITDDDQVVWPAVFDFANMAPNNYIAHDFVKLETELKIRVLDRVLGRCEFSEFLRLVQQFESALYRWTQHAHDGGRWPYPHEIPEFLPPVQRAPGTGEAVSEPVEVPHLLEQRRLLAILLEIRQRAAIQLGQRAGRPDSWLHEYLFWQLCYGLRGVTFPNLSKYQLAAAYLSAGVAASVLNARFT